MEEDIIFDPIFPVNVIAEEKQEEDLDQVELGRLGFCEWLMHTGEKLKKNAKKGMFFTFPLFCCTGFHVFVEDMWWSISGCTLMVECSLRWPGLGCPPPPRLR